MKWRIGLAQLMALIVVLALGLAAMKVASEAATQLVVLGSLTALLLGTVGALVRRRPAAWVGFSVFGWGYLAMLGVTRLGPYVIPNLDSTSWNKVQINGLVDSATNWLYPELPLRLPPFAYTSDSSTGKPILYRVNPTGMSPLTPDEFKEVVAYTDRFATREHRLQAASCAYWIGLAFQGLAFASLGAVAGHLLDRGNS